MCDTRLILLKLFYNFTHGPTTRLRDPQSVIDIASRNNRFPTPFLPQELNHKFSARPEKKRARMEMSICWRGWNLKFNVETCQPWRRQRERVGSSEKKIESDFNLATPFGTGDTLAVLQRSKKLGEAGGGN